MSKEAKVAGGRTEHLERLRRLVCAFLQPYQVHVYLFGSYARGDQRLTSDVDIAIEPCEALPTGLVSRLREAVEESDIPYEVEIVDLAQADERFRTRVLREGILWNAIENESPSLDKRSTR
ncbi:MAG: nucleotidyltransferase domain-containing protein [Anaerolineae bacterium]|nr:nucleotidyltransferase domain-containing protein [Candidatus Roseilinea sp.]MDW8450885.1 nucleotidyltransferase domain-containing protein [Anaerolineae bacterium]